MKVIKFKHSIPGNNKWNYTGVILFEKNIILFLKNAHTHNENGAAFISIDNYSKYVKCYYYNGSFCGNVFALKKWKVFVKNTKRKEGLNIFK